MTYPSVYPTGVTIYNPEKCWNGYTILPARELGALLINMNGAEVNLWKGLHGFPNKMLPGGYVLGHTGERSHKFGIQDQRDLVQVDWDGNIVWKFNQYEFIEDPGEEPQWMARLHHDYQREGNPVGYYVPGMDPLVDKGNTLILGHKNLVKPEISSHELMDDVIYEVNWQGDILWEWVCSDHFEELGFSEAAKNIMHRDPNIRLTGKGDWMHINSMSVLGPNKWYDAGDERFHPDNIIWDSRETNIVAIICKKTGKIVWKIGPDYDTSPQLKELGWIIGPHHAHMIPRGLPGEGNILIFDNGGWAGYGAPHPSSPTGRKVALRDYSRVLEFDPTTLKIVWQYTPAEAGFIMPHDANRFYSPFISGAQRLPNGNTLITEGSGGRIIEVTKDHEIVWEYISPYWGEKLNINMVYRAYRLPYHWVPQIEQPKETPIERIDVRKFRVPGAEYKRLKETEVEGVTGFEGTGFCVATDDELE
ncbi:aryl-sulfate sulfotransferase [Desulfofalx alkaliphila]|uniref:aryl-sulfate sulfotransferase n=1 Tax=Desulfofalx alkaliphila TaxID=105483 RepID=UPI0004E0F0F4|nr:aryl-sulfate sulfotransferase [Desulfofalx alkaliphila]